MYWTPPQYYGPPMYPPMGSQPPPAGQPGMTIKDLRKTIKAYQAMLKDEEDRKNKGNDGKKKEHDHNKKPSAFTALQMCMLLTFIAPFAGLLYVKAFLSVLSSIPH